MRRRAVLLLARAAWAAAALVTAVIGCCPDAFYEDTTPNPTVHLPRDEAPHCFGGGEWWYYTGRVTADDGAEYGVQTVIFHVPQSPYLLLSDDWIAHFAVLDVASGRFNYDQTTQRTAPVLVGMQPIGFDVATPLVQMQGGDGQDRIQAVMPDGSYALDLALTDERGPILHGGSGYVSYGADGHSFYYSRPRMHATGTLQINGQTHVVAGDFWFDRQWGQDITNPWLAWDWFSLRLDDGTDVMLFRFRDTGRPVAFGTYIPAVGDPVTLAAGDFDITPTEWWTSPHTGITYPVASDVNIGPQELALHISTVADDQELDVRRTTLNIYWEGLTEVRGTRAGLPIAGMAYVELTNYWR